MQILTHPPQSRDPWSTYTPTFSWHLNPRIRELLKASTATDTTHPYFHPTFVNYPKIHTFPMFFSLFSNVHRLACNWKQRERCNKIECLPADYFTPLSLTERKIHALPLSKLVSECRLGAISPFEIMHTYGKRTIIAHRATNCIADIMFDEALRTPAIANWSPNPDIENNHSEDLRCGRSLLGVPVSLKDTVNVTGHDSTIGFSRNVARPAATTSPIVRMLQDLGALVHVKTTVPAGLLNIETISEVFGRTTNPYSRDHSCGASSGGGGALVACGGSKIEIGSDLGGSSRIPAHFCGVWSLKGSVGRFPTHGNLSSLAGMEGVQMVTAPLAGSLDDLEEFWKRIVDAEPWEYDHTCVPVPWKSIDLQEEGRKLKWGIIMSDGIVPPTPASKRALMMVASALRRQGHEVVEFTPPNIFKGLKIAHQLIFADGGRQFRSLLESNKELHGPAASIMSVLSMPRFWKRILSYFTRSSDPVMADMLKCLHTKTVEEVRDLIAQRERYMAVWHNQWKENNLDFVLTVPHPLPALRNGTSDRADLMTADYTCIFNLLDYTAGVLPVTFVDKELDRLPEDFFASAQYHRMSVFGKQAYSVYDADDMHGLPLGVQVVGRRMEEEKVLQGMRVIEAALKAKGIVFEGNPLI